MTEGDTIGLSIAKKKKVYKKALKEAKIKLGYRSSESNLGRWNLPYTIADFLMNLLIIISNHIAL